MVSESKKLFQLAIFVLIGFNIWVWYPVFAFPAAEDAVYFLDVGQGDSELISFGEGEVKMLVDAGRGKDALYAIDSTAASKNQKYIDILIMTHPDLDHYGGFVEILKRYEVGLFVSNGRTADTEQFRALKSELEKRRVPLIELSEGDAIHYKDATISVLSPDKNLLLEKKINESSLVFMLEKREARVLFAGDIGFTAENILLSKNYNLKSDILKVGHHGSKNSSGEKFIAAVLPAASVIGVGQNRYGHPAPEVIQKLESAGSKIFRTDKDGTAKVILSGQVDSSASRTRDGFAAFLLGGRGNLDVLELSLEQLKKERDPEKAAAFSYEAKCVDINTASSERLMQIRHIGEKRAQYIIDARPFSSVNDLIKVKDIGSSRLADIIAEGAACVLTPTPIRESRN